MNITDNLYIIEKKNCKYEKYASRQCINMRLQTMPRTARTRIRPNRKNKKNLHTYIKNIARQKRRTCLKSFIILTFFPIHLGTIIKYSYVNNY